MNFNVNDVLKNGQVQDGSAPIPPAPMPNKPQPIPEPEIKETPVQRQMRLNREKQEAGLRVERVDPEASRLKSAVERDVGDALKELPNTIADMRGFGKRLRDAHLRLGLSTGGFPDQNVEEFNFKTGHFTGATIFMDSARINAELIMREPSMTDDQLDEFFMKYYMEVDANGNPLPKKYPYGKLAAPPAQLTPNVQPFPKPQQPQTAGPVNYQPQSYTAPPQNLIVVDQPAVYADPHVYTDPPSDQNYSRNPADPPPPPTPLPVTSEQEAADIKVKYKLEERPVNINRKKLDPNKLMELTEMTLDRNGVACTAVASRYKCDISPITYREYDQVRSMVETSRLAREVKLWSLIYRHVKNPTIGAFKTFNEFCEHTAWVDRRRFWNAMMCGMTKDEETVDITCINMIFKPIEINGIKYDISSYTERKQTTPGVSFLPTNKDDIDDMMVYYVIEVGDFTYKYIPILLDPSSGIVKWEAAEQMMRCGTEYEHKYINRSLIDTNKGEKWVNDEYDKINELASTAECIEYHNAGSLMSKRILQINETTSIEVGIKSVADVLRNDYKYVLDDDLMTTIMSEAKNDLKEIHGQTYEPTEDEVKEYMQTEIPDSTMIPIMGLSVIDKVVMKDAEGDEWETDIDADMIRILKNCRPGDIAPIYNGDIKNNLIYRYLTSYEPTFSYKDLVCPSCGAKSDSPIENIEDLVFTLSRSLTTTVFDIADM